MTDLSGMIELAKLLGQPAVYLVFALLMLVWGARSYVGLRKAISQDYRESVQETLKIVSQLQSAAESTPELEPIKGELLRKLGVVDRRLASTDRHIVSDTSLNALLAPEPMLVMGAAGALVMLVTNILGYLFTSVSPAEIGLGLSCAAALAVLKSQRSWLVRILYYILVALAIYAIAFGLNLSGMRASPVP